MVMDLPGCEREDIEIALASGTLSVRRRSASSTPATSGSARSRCPRDVYAEQARASWALGVLKIELPRIKEQARRIPVTAAA